MPEASGTDAEEVVFCKEFELVSTDFGYSCYDDHHHKRSSLVGSDAL